MSLQHNLINSFYIPDQQITNDNALTTDYESEYMKDNNNFGKTNESLEGYHSQINANQHIHQQEQQQSIISNTNCNASSKSLAPKPFLKQKSISRNQMNLNFNSISNVNNTSFLQKSFMQTKNNVLKKSNSLMINNYSPMTPPLTPTSGSNTVSNISLRNKLTAAPSFNIVEEIHEEIASGTTLTSSNNKTISKMSTSTKPENIFFSSISHTKASMKYNLKNLVFLDLYNNQIEKIENLDGLKSLTVLLLGKNRITDITGLISLKSTLRVLDLHGNKICNITNKISQLQELKSLNLAGNLIRQIQHSDFGGLFCLKELNLKRNRIKKICGFDDLHNLERLWLCHNDLQTIEDMQTVAKSVNLKEITIENNPISLGGDCVSFLVSYLPSLISLNRLEITLEVRRAANAWRRSKETTDQNFQHLSTDVCNSIRREEIISNARTNWELIRSQQSNLISASNRNNIKNVCQRQFTFTPKSSNHAKHSSSSISSTASSNNQQERIVTGNLQSKNLAENTTKSKESSSQENENYSEQDDELDEYFHLPPILTPYLEPEKNRSTSSMKPNVDSGSSNCSSDNDNDINTISFCKSITQTTPPINLILSQPPSPFELKTAEERSEKSYTPPLPIITSNKQNNQENYSTAMEMLTDDLPDNWKITNSISDLLMSSKEKSNNSIVESINRASLNMDNIDNKCVQNAVKVSSPEVTRKSELDIDKISNISRNSIKASSDSINTMSSSANDEQFIYSNHRNVNHHLTSVKNRSANQGKKVTPTLTRAQTARNFSVNPQSNVCIKAKDFKKDVEKDQGADYLVEICGRYLNIYGVGALKFVDKQWNAQKAHDVHTAKFSYINFNNICSVLGKVKTRFPNVENYLFRETNIMCFGQLNALADTQGIKSLTIEPEGNPITMKEWRSFAIYRLNHWGLKQINGVEITEQEIQEAEITFSGLADLILWSLPDSLLQPLFSRLHVEEKIQNNKITPKEWLIQYADESIRHVVGKEALQWKKTPNTQDELTIRRKGKLHFSSMIENTCNAVEKLHKLEFLWPTLLVEMIRNALIDYSQIDAYIRNLFSDALKDKQ